MEKISKQVEKWVEQKRSGSVFALEEILPENSGQREYFRVIKTLSKLQREQRVARIRKGLYFKPERIKFTNLTTTRASQSTLVDYFQKKFKNKSYSTGAPLFNGMGLTEQVATSEVLAVENPPKNFEKQRLFFIRAKCPINTKNVKYLQILDCLESVEKVPARYPGEVVDDLMDLWIKKLTLDECLELIKYSMYYSSRTRAVLASVFATMGKTDLAKNLRSSYSVGSHFKLYFVENKCRTLINKGKYGIFNTCQ